MSDRSAIKKFFEYKLDTEQVKKGPVKLSVIIILVLTGAGAGILLSSALPQAPQGTLAVGLAIIGLVVGYMISRHNVNSEYDRRLKDKEINNREFEALTRQVRAIIGDDLVKAFLRVFERTQIDRRELSILENKFSSLKDEEFFSEETLYEKLGDLMNKSVHSIAKGDFSKSYSRWVQLPGEDERKFIVNPTRLIVLFLTNTQLIICDVQIDSIDGNLREEIHRIAFPKIVDVHFTAERTRLKWDADWMVQTAKDLGYDEEKVKQIRESFEKKDGKDSEGDWVSEEMTSLLFITRTDSGAMSFPIRTIPYFGKLVSALDQAKPLTEDEIKVDRMVNELNRLVEKANLGPSVDRE